MWKRHFRYATDGTYDAIMTTVINAGLVPDTAVDITEVWDRVLAQVICDADAAGDIDWNISVDGTINRAHQHATITTRPDQDTGGCVELQESA